MNHKPLALIIEDESDLATIFSEALKAGGFATQIIRDGGEALERLKSGSLNPEVLILDLHLPNVSGKDILAYIRAEPRLADMRVLVATADAQLGDMVDPQADLVLLKPISFMQLQTLAKRLTQEMKASE
ncbi:MAG: response regulator [Anaerolineae bacterium]